MERLSIIFTLCLYFLLVKYNLARAQNTQVSGQLLNKVNEQPIPEASIYIKGYQGQKATTNAQGYFTLLIPEALSTAPQLRIHIQPKNSEIILKERISSSPNSFAQIKIIPPPEAPLESDEALLAQKTVDQETSKEKNEDKQEATDLSSTQEEILTSPDLNEKELSTNSTQTGARLQRVPLSAAPSVCA